MITVQGQPGRKLETLSNQTKAKRTGSMAQVVEHLPSKHKAWSSNPSTGRESIFL
jgi:hypothetical protein